MGSNCSTAFVSTTNDTSKYINMCNNLLAEHKLYEHQLTAKETIKGRYFNLFKLPIKLYELELLELDDCNIVDDDIEEILTIINTNPIIKCVNLTNNKISNSKLMEVIYKIPIKIIIIHDNAIIKI